MASREHKRSERRKRKERGAVRRAQIARRYEERNQAARDKLEPLREGERPAVVTVGAVISALIAVSVVVAYALGAEVGGERPPVLQVLVPALLMGVMSVGMWRARYWAVIGFQAVLAILMLEAALGLVGADTIAPVLGNLALIAATGTLFYLMVRAMARIQMPERRTRSRDL
jgi:hypothetical protein